MPNCQLIGKRRLRKFPLDLSHTILRFINQIYLSLENDMADTTQRNEWPD